MSKVILSQINPVNFVSEDKVNLLKYFSFHMDDYLHSVRMMPSQGLMKPFLQVWSPQDNLNLQVITDAGQPTLYVLNSCGSVLYSTTIPQRLQNTEDPTYFMYEISFPMNFAYDLNTIFYIRIAAGTLSLISEPLIFEEDLSRTLLIEYRNRSFYQNMIFEEGFFSSIRINALLRFKQAAAKDTYYEDQILDSVILNSKPFRVFELIIGMSTGTPDYLIDKLNRILGCSDLLIDGKYFTKNESAKWEEVETIANGALKIYSIELRETINTNSKVFDTEPEQIGGIFSPQFTFEFE